MNERIKEIKLIGPPFEYGGAEEADKPCMCGECIGLAQPKLDKPLSLLDNKKEVNNKD